MANNILFTKKCWASYWIEYFKIETKMNLNKIRTMLITKIKIIKLSKTLEPRINSNWNLITTKTDFNSNINFRVLWPKNGWTCATLQIYNKSWNTYKMTLSGVQTKWSWTQWYSRITNCLSLRFRGTLTPTHRCCMTQGQMSLRTNTLKSNSWFQRSYHQNLPNIKMHVLMSF